MATYYGTYGQKVQYLASDPTDPQVGQVWYNSTSATLKVRGVSTVGVWSSAANMNTGRTTGAASGTQTATLAFGGYHPSTGFQTASESYNGTTWTNTPSLNTGEYLMGGSQQGTTTAALSFGGGAGGDVTNQTESYNGSSWTIVSNYPGYVRDPVGTGTQTATLGSGGETHPPTGPVGATNLVVKYNGSSWTTSTSMPNPWSRHAGTGTQTATLVFGGATPDIFNPPVALAVSFNGSSWSSIPSMNTARRYLAGAGSQTAALAFGGTTNSTENYNGSTWTTISSLITNNSGQIGTGTASAALNSVGSFSGQTEEFNAPAIVTQTVTVT